MPTFETVADALRKFIFNLEKDKSYQIIAPKYILTWISENIPGREMEDNIIVGDELVKIEFKIFDENELIFENVPNNHYYVIGQLCTTYSIYECLGDISYFRYNLVYSSPFRVEHTKEYSNICNTCMRDTDDLSCIDWRSDINNQLFRELDRISEKHGINNFNEIENSFEKINKKNISFLFKCQHCNYWNCSGCLKKLIRSSIYTCPQCRQVVEKVKKNNIAYTISDHEDLLRVAADIIEKHAALIDGPVPDVGGCEVQFEKAEDRTDVLILKSQLSQTIRTLLPRKKPLFIINI